MKKIVMFALVACFATLAQAQIVSSTSREITKTSVTVEKTPQNSLKYIRMGAAFNKFKASYEGKSETYDSKLGYDVVYGFQTPIEYGVYYGLEFGLGSRGYSSEDYDEETSLFAHNIQIMPNLGWKYNFTKELALDLHFGIGASFDYYGTFTCKYHDEKEDWSIWDDDDYNKFDVYCKFGLGLWYNKFNIDLSFKNGFMNASSEDDDFSQKSRALVLSVGFAL